MSLTPFESRLVTILNQTRKEEYYNNKIDVVLLGILGNVNKDAIIEKKDDFLGYYQTKFLGDYKLTLKDYMGFCIKDNVVPLDELDKVYEWMGGDKYFENMDERYAHFLFPSDAQGSIESGIRKSDFFDRVFSIYFKNKSLKEADKFLGVHYSGSRSASTGYDDHVVHLAVIATMHKKLRLMDVLYSKISHEALVRYMPPRLRTNDSNYTKDSLEIYLKHGGTLLDSMDHEGKTLLASIKDPSNLADEENNKKREVKELTANDVAYIEKTYTDKDTLEKQAVKEQALYISRIAGDYRVTETFYKTRKSWNKEEWEGVPTIDYICADKDFMISYGNKIGSTQKGVASLNQLDSEGLSVLAYIANLQSTKYGLNGISDARATFSKIASDLSLDGQGLLFAETSDGLLVQRAKARVKLMAGLQKARKVIEKPVDTETRSPTPEPSPYDPRKDTQLDKWPTLGQILFGQSKEAQQNFLKEYGAKYKDYNTHYTQAYGVNNKNEHPWSSLVQARIVQAWARKDRIKFTGETWASSTATEDTEKEVRARVKEIIKAPVDFAPRNSKPQHFILELASLLTTSKVLGLHNVNQEILQVILPSIMEKVVTSSNNTGGKNEEVLPESVIAFFEAIDLDAPWMNTAFTCEDGIRAFFDGIQKGRKMVMDYTTDLDMPLENKILAQNVDLLPNVKIYENAILEIRDKQKLLAISQNKESVSTDKKAKTRRIGM